MSLENDYRLDRVK